MKYHMVAVAFKANKFILTSSNNIWTNPTAYLSRFRGYISWWKDVKSILDKSVEWIIMQDYDGDWQEWWKIELVWWVSVWLW